MGYDLYITRRVNWFDEGDDIPISEWIAMVKSDPEMRLDGFAEAPTTEGETIRLEAEGLAVWKAYSGHQEDGNKAWFYYDRGLVSVKNPDVEIRKKMYAVAQALKARLQGDEGEFYGPDGEQEEGEEPQQPTGENTPLPEEPRRPWWKIW
jgi:hypothetical protein